MPDTGLTTDTPTQPRRGITGGLFFLTIAFVAGIAAMGFALTRWDAARIWVMGEPEKPVVSVTPAPAPPLATLPPPTETLPVPTPTDTTQMAARLAAIESRLALVESQRATGGNGQAERLIAAFSARRALDRGLALGATEGLLTRQFGGSHPREVATITANAKQPVTRDSLRLALEALATGSGSASNAGWWDSFTLSMSKLFVVRQADAPPTDPDARIARAQQQLALGQVDAARAEIAQLPFSEAARAWVQSAQRYNDTQTALDRIEAAAATPVALPLPPPSPARSAQPAIVDDTSI
jgi:hypothetical protein